MESAAASESSSVEATVTLDPAELAEREAGATEMEEEGKPSGDADDALVFQALTAKQMKKGKSETRKVLVPPHRYTPLKESWEQIYEPLVEQMGLQVRMNVKKRTVELRTSAHTVEAGALVKGADFVKAFVLGFEVQDCMAILRLDDLYMTTFDVTEVKRLHGDHLSRAIGRVAGKGGKTKYTIENATKTRIVVADTKIHILGSFSNIKIAQGTISQLILGAPPGKVFNKLRIIAGRLNERF